MMMAHRQSRQNGQYPNELEIIAKQMYTKNSKYNSRERYSRFPRLSDTRYELHDYQIPVTHFWECLEDI